MLSATRTPSFSLAVRFHFIGVLTGFSCIREWNPTHIVLLQLYQVWCWLTCLVARYAQFSRILLMVHTNCQTKRLHPISTGVYMLSSLCSHNMTISRRRCFPFIRSFNSLVLWYCISIMMTCLVAFKHIPTSGWSFARFRLEITIYSSGPPRLPTASCFQYVCVDLRRLLLQNL